MKVCDPNRELRTGKVYSREAFAQFDRLPEEQKAEILARAEKNYELTTAYLWRELDRSFDVN